MNFQYNSYFNIKNLTLEDSKKSLVSIKQLMLKKEQAKQTLVKMGESHLETFKVAAQGNGWPTKVDILDTEWNLQSDEPVEDGGSNSGPNPMQYFTESC